VGRKFVMSSTRINFIVAKNVLDIHSRQNQSSELYTQYVLGQAVKVQQQGEKWCLVKGWDGCVGWCLAKWLVPAGVTPYASAFRIGITALIADVYSSPRKEEAEILTKVVLGTKLEHTLIGENYFAVKLPDGRLGFIDSDKASVETQDKTEKFMKPNGDEIVRTAKRLIGVPYLWGGTTPFGIDCSGLVQLVYRLHGITLPRNSSEQAKDSRMQAVIQSELQPGDLLFFAKSGDRISHVGISLGGTGFIHSSGDSGVIISDLGETAWKKIFKTACRPSL